MPETNWSRRVSRSIAWVVLLGSIGFVAMLVYAGGLGDVARAVTKVSPLYVLAAIGLVAVALVADALRYPVMAGPLGVTQPIRVWFQVALANLFGAYAANLGAPAAAYVLSRRRVDAGTSLALSIAKQSLFVPACAVPVCALLLADPSLRSGPLLQTTLWGTGAVGVATIACLVAVAKWPRRTAGILERTRLPAGAIGKFVDAISKTYGSPATLVKALLVAIINQAALAMAAAVLLAGFGADLTAGLVGRCFVFSALSQSAPTPAGAGVSELTGLWLFIPIAAKPIVVAQILAWRFVALQLPIILGGMIVAHAARSAIKE